MRHHADVRTIRDQLRADFEPLEHVYRARLAEYERAIHDRDVARFNACSTPSEEANTDLDMFLRKYFLDENGKPDLTKMPRAMVLPGLEDRQGLHQAAERVRGLKTLSGGVEPYRSIVVGWSESGIWDAVRELDEAGSRKKEEDCSKGWERMMRKHEAFVARHGSRPSRQTDGTDFMAAQGNYFLECKTMSEQYRDEAEDMHLNIICKESDHRLEASFQFGIIDGIMHLGGTLAGLPHGERDESDSDDEGDSEEAIASRRATTGNKRKGKGRVSSSVSKAKKAKASTHHTRRLYFKWAGRETGEEEIQTDYGGEHWGYSSEMTSVRLLRGSYVGSTTYQRAMWDLRGTSTQRRSIRWMSSGTTSLR